MFINSFHFIQLEFMPFFENDCFGELLSHVATRDDLIMKFSDSITRILIIVVVLYY